VALVVATIASMAQPYIFGRVIGVCADEGTKADLNKYIEILAVVNVIGMVATGVRGWLFGLAGERIVSNLRKNLFKKIISQDVSFFDSNKTGELINRLASDTAMLQAALSSNISLGLRNLASIVASVILLFITSWKLTLVVRKHTLDAYQV
jgi:ABC-type multidrug transport system fused ATPase/permease subunit